MNWFKAIKYLLSNHSRKVRSAGRAGVILDTVDKKYFIDSEWLAGKPDISLFPGNIYEIGKEQEKLPEALKRKIVLEVQQELEAQRLCVEIYPPIFDIYDSTDK